MHEYARILIEQYCDNHNSAQSRRLERLVEMSYDISAQGTDADADFLERQIAKEPDQALREAMQELYDFLFVW